jgi:hypothetical protein
MGFNNQPSVRSNFIIGMGQMPNITSDKMGNLHLVYGVEENIMYSFSKDGGKTFSQPTVVYTLPKLAASHTRGPQITATANGLLITACVSTGNIFSFIKTGISPWQLTGKVNDKDTVAKENLMALSSDGNNAYAVWLDLRDGHNKIFGARSSNGGKTWSKNILVYASPDKTVCECCKPSVAVKGKNVYVLFRNWLNGNRDMHLVKSSDGGQSFSKAEKLGTGNWTLNGCPMDGGGLALNKDKPVTIWNRKGSIYTCEPGKEEKELGRGSACTIKNNNGRNIYAWVEKAEVVVINDKGKKNIIGKGSQPVLEVINNQVICVWENEKQIHAQIVDL